MVKFLTTLLVPLILTSFVIPAMQQPTVGMAVSVRADTLLQGTWYLLAALPSDTAAGKIPTITFNVRSHSFKGNTGCNSMSGTFQLSDTSLQFNPSIIGTKIACPGYNEGAFLKNLKNINRYSIKDGDLILMFDVTTISRWSRKPFKQPRVYKA